MRDYGTTYSAERPEEVDVKQTKVFVATDIKEEKDGGYSYDLTEYDKDEYEAAQSGKKSAPAVRSGEQYFTTLNGYYCKDAAGRALLAELEDIVHPDLVTLNAVQNGVYVPTTSYGYGTVNVNVPFYARTDATLADVSTVEGDEMHIEPTAGTSYYPRLFLMATPSPNPELVDPVDVGKLFEPESGSWVVQPYIDIIDKATGQSVTGYPQQVHTAASYSINSGGYIRVKNWTYGSDKISVTTTRYNTNWQDPVDETKATQNDVDDWCSAYATGPYVVYDDLAKGTCGDNATWVLYKSGQLVISGTGTVTNGGWDSTKVVDVLVGEGITSLSEELFKGYTNIRDVHLPSTLTALGSGAFRESSLRSINIPEGIKEIPPNCFFTCSNLLTLTLPSTTTMVNTNSCRTVNLPITVLATTPPSLRGQARASNAAFSVTSPIYVPYDSVDAYKTAWSSYADQIQPIPEVIETGSCGTDATYELWNTGLLEISGTGAIADQAFGDRKDGIENVVINNGITSIGVYAFGGTFLKDVTIPDSVTSIGNNAFQTAYFTNITIPNNVTSIGSRAFQDCRLLTNITIPNNVTSIGKNAFFFCSALTDATILATTPPTAGTSIFQACSALTAIYVPAASVDAYKAANNWSKYASLIQAIPSGG